MVPHFDFLRHCATFFENFLMSQRVPLLSCLLFCNRMHVYKSKRSPLLQFSALCDLFRKKKIFQNFKFFSTKIVLRFLSLRYGADFRRSRLVFSKIAKPETRFQIEGCHPQNSTHINLASCDMYLYIFFDFFWE